MSTSSLERRTQNNKIKFKTPLKFDFNPTNHNLYDYFTHRKTLLAMRVNQKLSTLLP